MSFGILLALVSGFAIGVGVETVTNQSLYAVVWVLLLALVTGVVWRRGSVASPAPQLLLVAVFFLCLALGILRTQFHETKFTDALAADVGMDVELVGVVSKEPDMRSQQQILTVAVADSLIRVSVERTQAVSYGDEVIIAGTLKRPEVFTTELGRTFDYVGYLKAKGIEYTMSFAEVEVTGSGYGNQMIATLLAGKQVFMNALDQVITEPAGSLADGLLLGLNQGLGEQLEEDFRRSGIIHIVVLSGYNIMLVVTFTLFILSFFMRQKLKLLFGLGAIVSFALIVGLSATVVRASLMAALLLIAQTFGRSYDVWRALLVAGLVMIVINPYLLLFDIGFQLSFMATVGLLAALPWMQGGEQPEVITSIRGYIVATIATQIAVLPLLIYHIGQVSLVAVMVNVLVLPAVAPAMLGSFLAGLANFFVPTLGLFVGYLTEWLLYYIIAVASWFSALPFATMEFTTVSPWLILVMYSAIAGLFWRLTQPSVSDSTSKDTAVADWEVVEESALKVELLAKAKAGDDQRSSPATDVPKLFRKE